MERYKVKKAIKDLVKNINETTHIPIVTEDDIFELFQLDSIADLRKVSRNFLKLSKILDYFSIATEIATSEKEGIVKFGIENGNAVDVKDWIKGIGGVIGGYVSKVSNKEAGKWYLNDLTDGKIYKCIQNHTSTSFDTTKYLDISNYGLSDKLENLSENWQLIFSGLLQHIARKSFVIPVPKKASKIRILSSVGIDDLYNDWVFQEFSFSKSNFTLVNGEHYLNFFKETDKYYYFKVVSTTSVDDNYAYIYVK